MNDHETGGSHQSLPDNGTDGERVVSPSTDGAKLGPSNHQPVSVHTRGGHVLERSLAERARQVLLILILSSLAGFIFFTANQAGNVEPTARNIGLAVLLALGIGFGALGYIAGPAELSFPAKILRGVVLWSARSPMRTVLVLIVASLLGVLAHGLFAGGVITISVQCNAAKKLRVSSLIGPDREYQCSGTQLVQLWRPFAPRGNVHAWVACDTGKGWQEAIDGPQGTLVCRTDVAMSIVLRHDLDLGDGLPYGYVYWGAPQAPLRRIAVPFSWAQMHVDTPLMGLAQPPSSNPADVRESPKASYSIVITNTSDSSIATERVSLSIAAHQPLPSRYVAVWHRKGLIERNVTDVALDPARRDYDLFSGHDSIYQLAPGESFPLRVNILSAKPGVYSLTVKVSAVTRGHPQSFTSDVVTLVAPSEYDVCGLHVASQGLGDSLAKTLLSLQPEKFAQLAQRYRGSLITEEEAKRIALSTHVEQATDAESLLDFAFPNLTSHLSGIRLLQEKYGPVLASEQLESFLQEHPDSEPAKFFYVQFLSNAGLIEKARSIATDMLTNSPNSSLSHLALWYATGQRDQLIRAVQLDPSNWIVYEQAVLDAIEHNATLPSIFEASIKALDPISRAKLADTLIVANYDYAFGLSYRTENIALLLQLDPEIEKLMKLLPEYNLFYVGLFDRTLKRPPTHTINVEITPALARRAAYILARAGRYKLAQEMAPWAKDSETELIIRAMGGDLLWLVQLASAHKTGSLSKLGYLLCGVAALIKKKPELAADLIRKYETRYPLQTTLLQADLAAVRGNWDNAVLKAIVYNTKVMNSVFTKTAAHYVAEGSLSDMRVQFGAFASKLDAAKAFRTSDFLWYDFDVLLPHSSSRHTRWPGSELLDRRHEVGTSGVAMGSLLLYAQLWGRSKFRFVRLPDCVVAIDKTREHQEHIDTALAWLDGGTSLRSNGVYGRALGEQEFKASRDFHNALYLYWNEGKLKKAVDHLNSALYFDKKFLDAWVLRARIAALVGDTEQAKRDVAEAQKIGPLQKNDKEIFARLLDADL